MVARLPKSQTGIRNHVRCARGALLRRRHRRVEVVPKCGRRPGLQRLVRALLGWPPLRSLEEGPVGGESGSTDVRVFLLVFKGFEGVWVVLNGV